MGNLQAAHPVEINEELRSDPRWQLLSRILLTEPFQKSHRLPALLNYLGSIVPAAIICSAVRLGMKK